MAGLITATAYNVSPNLGGKMMKFEAATTATGDWLVFDDPIGAVQVNGVDGTVGTTVYAAGAVTATTVATATQTTVAYDGMTAAQIPTAGYVGIGTEIIRYAAGGAATDGTLTGCSRGCFGTTAATHAEDAPVYVLNTIVITTAGVDGPVRGIADVIEE